MITYHTKASQQDRDHHIKRRSGFYSLALTVARVVIFLVVGMVIFINWHDRVGRFAFFEIMDPPSADPHRTRHLRDAYYLIYSILGFVLGVVSGYRERFMRAMLTVLLGAGIWMVGRYQGMPELLNPLSEEGYYGIRALLLVAVLTVQLLRFIPWSRVRE